MNITKIVLVTTAFGFAANNAFAMQDMIILKNLEKFAKKNPETLVYSKTIHSLTNKPIIKVHGMAFLIAKDMPKKIVEESLFSIDHALKEKNFVSCRFTSGMDAVVCNTNDQSACLYAEKLDTIRMKSINSSKDCDNYIEITE